jgi:hypothetical protein
VENSSKALANRLFNQNFIPEAYLEILDQRNSIFPLESAIVGHTDL